ncbi:hypothetical protein UPYG_G00112560 [Umbra pygmaea]|uniref:Protein LIAT1 n=1 Tax=Umbra pygmaea TaxID=75934 RepID=A0ABD0X3K1_UMBPY
MSNSLLGMVKGLEVIVNSNMREGCELLSLSVNTETKVKKKNMKDAKIKEKRKETNVSKKRMYSSSPPNSEHTEKPQTAQSQDTSTSPPTIQESGIQLTKMKSQSCSRKCRKPKYMIISGSEKKSTTSITEGAPAHSSEGVSSELTAQALESMRWQGVLEDPLAEERRLEVYRAKRRQRYLLHTQEGKAFGSSVNYFQSGDRMVTEEIE